MEGKERDNGVCGELMTIRDRLPNCAVRQRSMIKRYRMLPTVANSWWNSRPNQNYKSAHILVNLAIVKIVIGLTLCRGKTGVSMQRIIWNGHSNVKTCQLPNVHPGFSLLDAPSDSNKKIFNKCTKSYGRQFFQTSESHLMWSIRVCSVT